MTVTAGEEFVLPERFRAKVLRRRGDGGAATPITESPAETAAGSSVGSPAESPAETAVRALAESYGVAAAGRSRWEAAIRLLALLADVPDAEYAEAMAAASEYRGGTREQRALTSFLFRERTDWVDADVRCDAVLDGRPSVDLACRLLATALTTADQAREFAARQHWRKWPAEEVVPTMLASVGTAVTPLVLAWLDDEWYREEDDHQRLLALVSELGTEESIRALTDRLCWKSVQSHLFAGGELFPRRTLRVLAETDPEAQADVVGERYRALWTRHVGHALVLHATTYPEVAREELPTLSPAARARVEARAGEKIAEIAENLGLTAEQLADRLAPVLGLDADGTLTLDFGARRFVAGFDAELKPYVRDETGKRLKALPKPGANDDPEPAKAATASFSALKKEARTVVADQVARLERAMVMRRRWTPAEFSAFFVRHPLVRHIARQVVWAAFDARGEAVGTFRVAEDQTFADLGDELFTLPEGVLIGVAHPLDLGASIGRWSDVLADYQILQPFAQLGRQPHVLADGERAALVLKRFAGIEMPAGRVLGLTRRGWRRGEPWGDGYETHIERPLPDGRVVIAGIRPGIAVGFVSEAEDQCFADIWVSRDGEADYRPVPEWSDPFGTLDPVTASEILRDLTEVTAQ